jgi:hypothetical protein
MVVVVDLMDEPPESRTQRLNALEREKLAPYSSGAALLISEFKRGRTKLAMVLPPRFFSLLSDPAPQPNVNANQI